MKEFETPVIIGFPLRGEWMAPNTPGKKIPSHGTDQLGERYAFDFLQVDWARTGGLFYHTSLLRILILLLHARSGGALIRKQRIRYPVAFTKTCRTEIALPESRLRIMFEILPAYQNFA